MRRPLVIHDFALLHSEFPYIWGKFDFLFYQCRNCRQEPQTLEVTFLCINFVSEFFPLWTLGKVTEEFEILYFLKLRPNFCNLIPSILRMLTICYRMLSMRIFLLFYCMLSLICVLALLGLAPGALQMKGRWKSNINAWFPFMFSQK